jgi:hypothetical protein
MILEPHVMSRKAKLVWGGTAAVFLVAGVVMLLIQ